MLCQAVSDTCFSEILEVAAGCTPLRRGPVSHCPGPAALTAWPGLWPGSPGSPEGAAVPSGCGRPLLATRPRALACSEGLLELGLG